MARPKKTTVEARTKLEILMMRLQDWELKAQLATGQCAILKSKIAMLKAKHPEVKASDE